MKSLAPRDVKTPGRVLARRVAVPWVFLLIVLGACFAGSAAIPDRAAGDADTFDASVPVRHMASLSPGRTVLAAIRPVAKKAASKGADNALSVAVGAPLAPQAVGARLPHPRDAGHPQPAPSGYFARAPPGQA